MYVSTDTLICFSRIMHRSINLKLLGSYAYLFIPVRVYVANMQGV